MANNNLQIRPFIRFFIIFITTIVQIVSAQTKCNFTLPFSKNDLKGIIIKNPDYKDNIYSCWHIVKVEHGFGLILEFENFNLQEKACFDENNNPKCCDYLQIGIGNQVHKNVYSTLCGMEKIDPIYLESNTVWFNFHTDSSVIMDGYKIKVNKLKLSFNEPSGQLSIPVESKTLYTNNLNLTYRIQTEENSVIFLRFERLSIESFNNTCVDYLEIGSLNPKSKEKPRIVCGDDTIKKIIINSNQIYLKFYSDKTETSPGFSIFYNTIKNLYTEPTGVIESTKYAINFTYKIIAPEDKLIELMVDVFNFKKCLLNNTELLMDSKITNCPLSNDYLIFQNEIGSLNETFYKEISNLYSNIDVNKNWMFCGCIKPAKLYLSLTNELSIKYFVSTSDQNSHENFFKLSYKFVSVEKLGINKIRVVQNSIKNGFIGGHILNLQIPANNHLRLYGKSAKCSFPKQSLIVKEQNDQILSINQLNVSNEDFKKNCSYTIDFAEPKSDFFTINKNFWRFIWFLKIDSPIDIYDFEINWQFLKNQIADEKRDYEISLPSLSGFELNDRIHDELSFYFKTTTNRRYTLSFMTSPKYFIDLQDSANYIKIKAKNSNKIDNFISVEHLNNRSLGFVLNGADSLLKVKRNSKYSIKIVANLDRENGDCNFDNSICDFTLNPFINQTVFSSVFTANDGYLIQHMPKYTDLNSDDFEIEEKSKDFYLMISKTSYNDDALYSPLIITQEQDPNGKWNYNRRIYSISFSYMMSNGTSSELEVFFVQNRTDTKLRNDFFRETIGIFNKESFLDNVIISEPKLSNECPSNSFSFLLNEKSTKTIKLDRKIESQANWYRVNRARFFSCFDFRFGFAINIENEDNLKSTKINPFTSTIGLDDIELNDEGELSYCPDKNCNNNGKCFEFNSKPTCCCNPGYEGENCEIKLNACEILKKVCKNDGKCRNLEKSFDYKCECSIGYTGKNCETEINECDSNPCINDGKCIDLVGGYECVCRNGFNGKKCELKDDRCKELCSSIGTAECFIDRSKAICKCKRDFTGDDCSKKIKINKCFDDPCVGDAKCVPDGAGFKCICPPDRSGVFCEKNVNFCEKFENLCRNGSVCIFANEDGSKFKCSCQAGFTGKYCDEPINDCEPNPCINGKCTDLILGYKCECYKGFIGKHCDVIPKNPCYKHKCLNGVCIPNQSNYTCSCHKNYAGDYCNEEKCDREVFMNEICNREGTLKVVSNDNKCLCLCKKDYIGEKCETRLNLCELRSKTFEMEEECLNGGTCVYNNKTNEVKCLCATGFFGDRCQIIENYCKSNPCKYGNCKSEHESYKCLCSKGWKGRNCDEQNNDCNLIEDCVTSNTDKVLFSKNQCVCVCKHGFTGDRCQINIENCDPNPCRNDGKCKDLVGSFQCECQPGYAGPYCEKKITDCANNPCKNGTCIMHGSHLTCNCDYGYYGEFCEKFIDQCIPNPCKNSGKCHNMINDYYCECPPEFGETKNCSIQIINPCDSSPCFNNGSCNPKASSIVKINGRNLNTYNGFKCQCPSNFKGEFCEQSVDPCSSNPCKNRGKCILNKGDEMYKCVCSAAFTGKYCETYIDPCRGKNICQNDGICLPTTIGPRCQCPFEFGGENCEIPKNSCDLMKCMNGGLCTIFNNIPYCKCQNTRFIGTRCEIDISANNSREISFNSALTNPISSLSCDLLGNDVGAIDYIFLALILFGLIILVITIVYVYVYIGIKRTKKYNSQVQHDNDILGEINEIDKRYL